MQAIGICNIYIYIYVEELPVLADPHVRETLRGV